MDYAQGQGLGWFIVLFYIIPVLLIYPILLILSLIFKWPKFRKVITIFSLPVLPLYFFYPIMSFSNRLYRFICPYSLEKNDAFISHDYHEMIFAIITLGLIFYLIRLYKRQEKEKIKKTLIIYVILFVLFIGVVVLDAVMSKRLYAEHHSIYLPYLSAIMNM